jgi:hypothetical protein
MTGHFKFIGFVTVVLVFTAAMQSPAGVLGPKHPSDLLTLTTSFTTCGSDPVGLRLDEKQNPDGTTEAFAIPPGQVLVVTGFDWTQGSTGAANKAETIFLHSETATGVILPLVVSHDDGSGDGRAGASVAVTGVVFKSGQTLCYSANTGHIGSALALVHGFLAKDK